MQSPGHPLFARTGLALNQHRTGAGGDGGQHLEQALHHRAAADEIARTETPLQFLTQRVQLRQVAENLRPADDLAPFVLEHRRRNADRYPITIGIDDVRGFADDRPPRFQRLLHRALRSAQAGPEHLRAGTADSLPTRHARDLLRRPVERSHTPPVIHREHTI